MTREYGASGELTGIRDVIMSSGYEISHVMDSVEGVPEIMRTKELLKKMSKWIMIPLPWPLIKAKKKIKMLSIL